MGNLEAARGFFEDHTGGYAYKIVEKNNTTPTVSKNTQNQLRINAKLLVDCARDTYESKIMQIASSSNLTLQRNAESTTAFLKLNAFPDEIELAPSSTKEIDDLMDTIAEKSGIKGDFALRIKILNKDEVAALNGIQAKIDESKSKAVKAAERGLIGEAEAQMKKLGDYEKQKELFLN